MWRMRIIVLGLTCCTAAGSMLVAQQPVEVQKVEGQKGQKKGKPKLPAIYLGIPLTAAQKATFDTMMQRHQDEASKRSRQVMVTGSAAGIVQQGMDFVQQQKEKHKQNQMELKAVLTPEQQKTLERNQQIVDLASNRPTTRMLMGTNLTDEQMAALKKLVAEQEERRRAVRASSDMTPAGRNQQQRVAVKELDEFHALLTPAQQKVAAPEYAAQKAMREAQAKDTTTRRSTDR
jgi:hypothetical protein